MNRTHTPALFRVSASGLQPCDCTGETAPCTTGSPVVVFARGRQTAWKFWDFPPVPAQALPGLVATKLEAEALVDSTELAWACDSLTLASTTTRRVSVCVVPGKALSEWRAAAADNAAVTPAVVPLAAACALALGSTVDWQLVTWIDALEAECWLIKEGRVWAVTQQRHVTGAWNLCALEESAATLVQQCPSELETPHISCWTILKPETATIDSAASHAERLNCPLEIRSHAEFDLQLAEVVRQDLTLRPAQRILPVIRTPADLIPVQNWRTQSPWFWRGGIAAATLLICLLMTSLVNARISEQQIDRLRQQLSQTESLNTRLRTETAVAGEARDWLARRVAWTGEFRRLSEIAATADGCQIQAIHTQMGADDVEPSLRIQGMGDTSEAVVALQQKFLEEVPEYQLIPYGIRPRNQRGEAGVQFEFELIRRDESESTFDGALRKDEP